MLYQGYSNRSTILFRAGEFTLCAEDVEAALDYSDKSDKEFLLLDRKAKCLMKDVARRHEARGGRNFQRRAIHNSSIVALFLVRRPRVDE